MNKQFVIAALLGSTQAAVCKDAYTDLADAQLAKATGASTAAEAKVTKATEAATVAQTTFEKKQGLKTPIDDAIAPFNDAVAAANIAATSAATAYNGANDGSTDVTIALDGMDGMGLWTHTKAKMEFTANKTDLTALATAKTEAGDALGVANTKLGTLGTTLTNQEAELTRRVDQTALYLTQKTTHETALTTVTDKTARETQYIAAMAKTTAEVDTTDKKNAIVVDLPKVTVAELTAVHAYRVKEDVYKALDAGLATAYGDQNTAYTNAEAQFAQERFKYLDDNVYSHADVCTSDGSACYASGWTGQDRATNILLFATLTGLLNTYGTEKTEYEALWNTHVEKKQEADVLLLGLERVKLVATGEKDAAIADTAVADTDSITFWTNSTKAVENATAARDATNVEIAAQNELIQKIKNNQAIATHIHELASDKFANLKAAKDDLANKKAHADKQQELAVAAQTRATQKLSVYTAAFTVAQGLKTAADGEVTACNAAFEAAKTAVIAATAHQATALANCKGVKYRLAQEAYKAWKATKDANEETATQVAAAWETESTPPKDGVENSRCEYPAAADDGTQNPRPVCNDELCCGSANKYLRDGTRLTVESCQKNKGTHTYTYYPKIKTGATVKPKTELWRFYCIQGAQKLAATLAAATGAAYFMA